ncbi:MAG: DUF4177 domain-containing protein [Gemmobacter sp.]
MQVFEYKVIPAPRRGEKARGAKTVAERFGVALAHAMNDMAAEGWEYLRADTLPCEERVGLTGTATHFQNMLVFRRALRVAETARAPVAADHAAAASELPEPMPMQMPQAAPEPPPHQMERTVLSPFATPAPGVAPPVGPAAGPAAGSSPVVPFPNGRG